MRILAISVVTGEARYLENGDALIARFDCELAGMEITARLIRNFRDNLVVRFPLGCGVIRRETRRALAELAFAEFTAAGGVEDPIYIGEP